MIVAVEEKRFAAWADPVSLRHREQWQRKKLSNGPDTSKVMLPHRQEPTVLLSILSLIPAGDCLSLTGRPVLAKGVTPATGRPLMFAVALGNRDMKLSAQTGRPNQIHCRALINSEPESGALISPSSRTPCCTVP